MKINQFLPGLLQVSTVLVSQALRISNIDFAHEIATYTSHHKHNY